MQEESAPPRGWGALFMSHHVSRVYHGAAGSRWERAVFSRFPVYQWGQATEGPRRGSSVQKMADFREGSAGGQGWIRTSVGPCPADLQSATKAQKSAVFARHVSPTYRPWLGRL
jgi:hypothetical protein